MQRAATAVSENRKNFGASPISERLRHDDATLAIFSDHAHPFSARRPTPDKRASSGGICDRIFTSLSVQSRAHTDTRTCMRAVITVERHRSTPSSYLVGPQALTFLQTLPGVSDVRVDHEGTSRAVLSYRWRDP